MPFHGLFLLGLGYTGWEASHSMKITEIFYSTQGEGAYAGIPMAFVRFQGCPYRCVWCDSAHTWDFKGGDEMPLEQVVERVAGWPARHVCITGGEPLAHPRDFQGLTNALKERGYWIEVETAGGHLLPRDAPIDSWVVDVKCPASGMQRFNKYANLPKLRPQDQLKFVVAGRGDFEFSLEVIAKHRPQCYILFSPVWGQADPAQLAERVKAKAPQARLSLQIHKVIWAPDRRGV